MSRRSPLGAFCGGLVAGLVGAFAQSLFFSCTRKLAPVPPTRVFDPAEPEQRTEMPTQTVARRVTEQLARRGPLEHEEGAARAVHFAFGSAWGGLYGLVAGTLPRAGTLKGSLAFGAVVWLVSDDILLPAFRLSAWPHHYPVKMHLYAIAAHAVYGAAVAATFAALGRAARPATAALGSLWVTRRVPRLIRPTVRRAVERGMRLALPVRDAYLALT
jgi:putative membrane protein